jgi:hypothetical protein
MSPRPSEGIYVIINRVLSPTGEELAITSNGEDKPVTLIPRSDSESQQVSIFFKKSLSLFT